MMNTAKWEKITFLGIATCTVLAIYHLVKGHKHHPEPPAYPYLHIRNKELPWGCEMMDPGMKQLQQALVEVETNAEHLILARHKLIENDKLRNGNREALTALRRRARTTKSSIPSSFGKIMNDLSGTDLVPLVKEICSTCGDHDPKEQTWMMFPGSDIFARMAFHAVHTVLDKDHERLDHEAKTLQSYVKEKSIVISQTGALADRINPVILQSLVSLKDERK